MRIATQEYLSKNNNLSRISSEKLIEAQERLSTGLRINSAKDDSAGLSISQRLEARIRGNNAAKRNIDNASSMVNTTEGSLSSMQDMLQRMRELAIQSQNGTMSISDRNTTQMEFNQLLNTLSDVSAKTTFNGIPVLSASNDILDNKLIFNGTDSYILINNSPSLNPTKEVTLEATITPFSFKPTWQGVVLKQSIGSYEMWIYGDKPMFGVRTTAGFVQRPMADFTFKAENTYKLTYSYDGSNANFYIDGNKIDSIPISAGDIITDNRQLYIGYSGYAAEYFDGVIEDVRMYTKALNDTEIKNNSNGMITHDQLAGEWKLNDGTNLIKDSSGNGNNGTIVGNPEWEGSFKIRTGSSGDDYININATRMNNQTLGIGNLELNDSSLLSKIDQAMSTIEQYRGELGSYENALNRRQDHITESNINLTQSNSRIKDVEFADVTSQMIKMELKHQMTGNMFIKAKEYYQSALTLLNQ